MFQDMFMGFTPKAHPYRIVQSQYENSGVAAQWQDRMAFHRLYLEWQPGPDGPMLVGAYSTNLQTTIGISDI